MKSAADISVVLATCNHAQSLQRTLEGFVGTLRDSLHVDFVIIDNNSTDHTRSVIRSFESRLPIQYLHEAKPGKCAALNRALDSASLGKIIFFTDDDVEAASDLFVEVAACGARHPSIRAFGGEVHLVWPPVEIPEWALVLARSSKGYSHINLGTDEAPFPSGRTPMGTNWWVRRDVVEAGYRFDERIGPGSHRCNMGDETAFLLRLGRDGCVIVYAPRVRMGHRVPERLLREKAILQRALDAGRAGAFLAYAHGFGPKRWIQNPLGWRLLRGVRLVQCALRFGMASFAVSHAQRVIGRWDAMQGVGWNLEALRMGSENGGDGDRDTCGAPLPGLP